MHIRPAQESEAEHLSQIAQHSKAHWGYSSEQLKTWQAELTVSADLINQNICYIAEIEGQAAGFFVLIKSTPSWQLEHFWVLPAYMGQGIGRALMNEAKKQAQQAGAESIHIDSDPQAEGFYLACGATRVGSLPAPLEGQPERVRPQLLLATSMP